MIPIQVDPAVRAHVVYRGLLIADLPLNGTPCAACDMPLDAGPVALVYVGRGPDRSNRYAAAVAVHDRCTDPSTEPAAVADVAAGCCRRTWVAGDDEPGPEVTRVRTRAGELWTLTDNGAWKRQDPHRPAFTYWRALVNQDEPLYDVTPAQIPAVATSEEAPVDRPGTDPACVASGHPLTTTRGGIRSCGCRTAWFAGNDEPGPEVTRVRDKAGAVWARQAGSTDWAYLDSDGEWCGSGAWTSIVENWGPVVDVSDNPGAVTQDPPRRWEMPPEPGPEVTRLRTAATVDVAGRRWPLTLERTPAVVGAWRALVADTGAEWGIVDWRYAVTTYGPLEDATPKDGK